jgi:transcriptional regulator with XRE-family HTH domain
MANEGPQRLIAKIERQDGTQNAAAERLEISAGHLSDLLSGRRTPSLRLALKIQSEYGVPVTAWSEVA